MASLTRWTVCCMRNILEFPQVCRIIQSGLLIAYVTKSTDNLGTEMKKLIFFPQEFCRKILPETQAMLRIFVGALLNQNSLVLLQGSRLLITCNSSTRSLLVRRALQISVMDRWAGSVQLHRKQAVSLTRKSIQESLWNTLFIQVKYDSPQGIWYIANVSYFNGGKNYSDWHLPGVQWCSRII